MSDNQVNHIKNNKKNLELRFEIIKKIREFFWVKNFLEVETPFILALPGQEPYLSPMKVEVQNEKGQKYQGYLHTSPEYTMKKMLAAGFENIFSICKCFRDQESFGGTHNPEFTMIEWYRARADFYKIMDDTEELFYFLAKQFATKEYSKFERISMRDLWKKHAKADLNDYLEIDQIFALCTQKGYKPNKDEKYEDLFYRIFLNEIEPKLIEPVIVHHYPIQMAALSIASKDDSRYAERFEVYIDGLELANAFTELTDADEQYRRLQEEQNRRRLQGQDVYDIDLNFIEALKNMPPSTGIALGVDRLIQILLGCQNINNVLVLPMSKMF